ncbi:TlpA family protein disulfide reductase [Lacinutrix jangbogonensis]|uniref:TlpA family protein disulfide reductase n=1 Tax=Lacinutrix jangbogonensis TaxID=1469557 RepID=UPI00053EB470|nr:TlpA disulfide reductase family protein [Lacinutrix jangbogonensis]
MKKIVIILILFIAITNCKAQEEPIVFTEKALADIFIDTKGDEIAFSKILKAYKGKQIVIDIWASWCKDCVKGMPKIKKLQTNNKETVFLFLSLDKSEEAWKKGIKKYTIEGEHYFIKSGWKSEFASFLDLDWIPRYLVIDKTGNIKLFRAVKADDQKLKSALKI